MVDEELLPETCELRDHGELAYTISCTEGEGMFVQNVERSFRLQDDDFSGIQVTTDIDADGLMTPQDFPLTIGNVILVGKELDPSKTTVI